MTKDTDNKILKKLTAIEKEEGKTPLLLQFFRDILRIQAAVRKQIGTPQVSLSDDTINKRIEQGIPILTFKDINIDLKLLKDTFVRVADTFAEYPGLFGEIPEKLKKPETGRLLTKKAIQAWYTGEALPPAMLNGASVTIIGMIIQSTLKPC